MTTIEHPTIPYTSAAGGRLLAGAAFALPPLVLLAVGFGLAFRGGGVVADQWQPVALGAAASLLVLSAVGALPSVPRRAWVVLALWTALLVWATVSLAWSLSREATFEAATRVAMLAAIVTIGAVYASRPRAAIALAAGIAVSGSLIGLLIEVKLLAGATEMFAGERLAWPVRYANADAALLCISVPALTTFAAAHPLRPFARGSFGLLASLLLALGLAAQSRGAVIAIMIALGASLVIARDRGRLALTLYAVAIPVTLVATRMVDGNPSSANEARELGLAALLAALAGGLLVGVVALLDRRNRLPFGGREARVARILGCVFAVAAVALFIAIAGRPDYWIGDRWNEFRTTDSTTTTASLGTGTSTRYEYWRVALDAGLDHPLAGVGAGAYSVPWFQKRSLNENVTDAHSWQAGAFAELGLVGLVLTATALLIPLAGLRVARKAEGAWPIAAVALGGVVVYFVVHASLEWLQRMPPVAIPALLALGALAGAGATSGLRLAGRRARSSVAGVALLATLLVLPAYVSTAALSRAETDAPTEPDRALDALETATRFNPFAVQPLIQRATMLHFAGDDEGARRAGDRAIARGPNDWAAWMVATEARSFAGDEEGARAARRRALELNPRSQPFPWR
jgi:O-antigen ligase/polysaccharide polymerase Wzy-like membrane protein